MLLPYLYIHPHPHPRPTSLYTVLFFFLFLFYVRFRVYNNFPHVYYRVHIDTTKVLTILHINAIVDHKWHSISTYVRICLHSQHYCGIFSSYHNKQHSLSTKILPTLKLSLSLTFTGISIINLGSTPHLFELGSSVDHTTNTHTMHTHTHIYIRARTHSFSIYTRIHFIKINGRQSDKNSKKSNQIMKFFIVRYTPVVRGIDRWFNSKFRKISIQLQKAANAGINSGAHWIWSSRARAIALLCEMSVHGILPLTD